MLSRVFVGSTRLWLVKYKEYLELLSTCLLCHLSYLPVFTWTYHEFSLLQIVFDNNFR